MTEDRGASASTTTTADKVRRVMPSGFATLRDLGTFCIGMTIIVNEVFLSAKVEPAAVAIGLSLTGLPLVFGADERRNRSNTAPSTDAKAADQ